MNAVSRLEFSSPSAGYDQPLEMWIDCHKRIARMNALLQRLVDHLKHHAVDKHAGVTATSIRRYFDEAAPRHHEDEEVDLFPLLRRRLPDRAPQDQAAVVAALDRLQAEHADLGGLWQQVRAVLVAIESGLPASLDPDLVQRFASGYRAHCEIEDTVVAEALKRCLAEADLDALGQSMAERRGVDWTHLHSSRAGGR
jgi:hemerythrin-like domain-containing protein